MAGGVMRCSGTLPVALRVLIVDDDTDTRELFGIFLERRGYSVRLAASASAAMIAAAEFFPAVILADIGLPDLDGFELARRLLALPGLVGCRLVAVTGHTGADVEQHVKEAGFAAVLTKPVPFEALVAAIEGAELSAAAPTG